MDETKIHFSIFIVVVNLLFHSHLLNNGTSIQPSFTKKKSVSSSMRLSSNVYSTLRFGEISVPEFNVFIHIIQNVKRSYGVGA